MKASVVIPTYDQVELLRRCLRSLENQSVPKEAFEVMVVNDGSEDETSAFLEGYRPDFTLKVITHPRNLGRAAARNSGAKEAAGEILIFLDGDSTADSSFLAEHIQGCDQDERCVCIGNVKLPAGYGRIAFKRYLASRGVQKLKPSSEIPFRYFASGNVSLHRKFFEKVGGFDPSFSFYGGEDLELGVRLLKQVARFRFLPNAVSYHHLQDELRQAIGKKYAFGKQTLPMVVAKHPGVTTELPQFRLAESALFRFLVSDLFYVPALSFARALGRVSLPHLLFDYLFHGATVRGLLDGGWERRNEMPPTVRGSKLLPRLFALWIIFVNLYYYVRFVLTRSEKLELVLRQIVAAFK